MSTVSSSPGTWLKRVARDRKVFAYCQEFGHDIKLLEGIEAVAPFFKPWHPDCKLHPVLGEVGLEVPLANLLLSVDGRRILEQLAGCGELLYRQFHGALVRPVIQTLDRAGPEAAARVLRKCNVQESMQTYSDCTVMAALSVHLDTDPRDLQHWVEMGELAYRMMPLFRESAPLNLVRIWSEWLKREEKALLLLHKVANQAEHHGITEVSTHLVRGEAWQTLFQQSEFCEQAIDTACHQARDVQNMERGECAFARVYFLNDPDGAWKLLQTPSLNRTGRRPFREPLFWSAVWDDQQRVYDQIRGAEQRLLMALNLFPVNMISRNVVELAEGYQLLLGDTASARRCLKYMEEKADDIDSLCEYSEHVRCLLNDEEYAAFLLEQAASKVKDVLDCYSMFNAYRLHPKGRALAVELFDRMREKPLDEEELNHLKDAFTRFHHDDSAFESNLAGQIEQAGSMEDLVFLGRCWMSHGLDPQVALLLLQGRKPSV